MKKRYNTQNKRIKFLKTKGNIISFKKPFIDYHGESHTQVLIKGLEKDRRTDAVKVIGLAWDSEWFDDMDELVQAVDWEYMEKVHRSDSGI